MRLRNRKLYSSELTGDDNTSRERAPDQLRTGTDNHASADERVNNTNATMGERSCDVAVISSVLGGYSFPAPNRYDED